MIANPARLSAVALAFLFLFLAPPLTAQRDANRAPDGEPADVTAVAEASALLTEIDDLEGQLRELNGTLADLEGEEADLVRSRMWEIANRQRDNLSALVDLLESFDDSSSEVADIEQAARQALNRASRELRDYIGDFTERLQAEVATRQEVASTEAQKLERRLAIEQERLDQLYLMLISLVHEMEAAGLAVDEEREFLSERLSERSQTLLGSLGLTRDQLATSRDLLQQTPEDSELQSTVYAEEQRFEAAKDSLQTTVRMMRMLDLEHADLEVRLLELTGEVTPEALDVDVALGLAGRSLSRLRSYLADNGPALLLRFLLVIAILAAAWFLARLVRAVTRRALERTQVSTSRLLEQMIVSLSGRLTLLVGLVFALTQLGIDLGPLLAGFGIAGLVIGFALQDTLANFAAGAMILAYRPFDEGDLVETAGVLGKVHNMTLVSTHILTPDHQSLVVPNSKIWGDVIRNITAQRNRRVDMIFGISYEDDVAEAEHILEEIVTAHDKVLEDPAPVIKLHELADSSVNFVVRPWARSEDYWDVYWDVTRAVKMRFDAEGISIPYPQRDVHLIRGNAETS